MTEESSKRDVSHLLPIWHPCHFQNGKEESASVINCIMIFMFTRYYLGGFFITKTDYLKFQAFATAFHVTSIQKMV